MIKYPEHNMENVWAQIFSIIHPSIHPFNHFWQETWNLFQKQHGGTCSRHMLTYYGKFTNTNLPNLTSIGGSRKADPILTWDWTPRSCRREGIRAPGLTIYVNSYKCKHPQLLSLSNTRNCLTRKTQKKYASVSTD